MTLNEIFPRYNKKGKSAGYGRLRTELRKTQLFHYPQLKGKEFPIYDQGKEYFPTWNDKYLRNDAEVILKEIFNNITSLKYMGKIMKQKIYDRFVELNIITNMGDINEKS